MELAFALNSFNKKRSEEFYKYLTCDDCDSARSTIIVSNSNTTTNHFPICEANILIFVDLVAIVVIICKNL